MRGHDQKRGVEPAADRAGRLDDGVGDGQDPAGPGDVSLAWCLLPLAPGHVSPDQRQGKPELPWENIRLSAS